MIRAVAGANVWALLLEGQDDAIDLAENVIAAAIGADADPTLLTERIGFAVAYVFAGPEGENTTRALRLVAAFAGISRGLTSIFGSAYAEVREEAGEEVDPLERRNAESHALHHAVEQLRETIADSGDD